MLDAGVFDLEATRALRVQTGHADATAVANDVARRLLAMGAAEILAACVHTGLKRLVAAHLSERNNRPR